MFGKGRDFSRVAAAIPLTEEGPPGLAAHPRHAQHGAEVVFLPPSPPLTDGHHIPACRSMQRFVAAGLVPLVAEHGKYILSGARRQP